MTVRRALFEAWRGRYSDSPKVLSERLGVVAPEIERVWVASDRSAFPPDVTCVRRHRGRHFAHLLSCDLLVTNDIVTRHIVKGPRVTYVQTWHGSPIKVIGLDELDPKYRNAAAHQRKFARDVAKWDLLVSPSPVYTEIFRRAFGFDGEVLESGYPRNDVLLNDDGSERARIRARLGLETGQTAVLYAPTWRDDAQDDSGKFFQPELIDWDVLAAELPSDVVVLSRLHHNVRVMSPQHGDVRIVDVSGYPDVTELILASDALVSDYSSIIYDYSLTRRPIVLHAPDLDRYRNDLRPFYFDFEQWAPGPITTSTPELAARLGNLTAEFGPYRHKYDDFVRTYCTFEDGRAAERVIERVLDR